MTGSQIIDRRAAVFLIATGLSARPWVSMAQPASHVSVRTFGASGDGKSDDTAAISAALAAHDSVSFPSGAFRISGPLTLRSGHNVVMSAKTVLHQTRANTPIFSAYRQSGITVMCNRAQLIGEGSWSPDWTGNGGHDDRAFFFIGCNRVTIDNAHIQNCAHSGIAFIGGHRIRLNALTIEGTHRFSTPIPREGNFQIGIYLKHDADYGAVDDVQIIAPDISGTAQGIVSELDVGAPQPAVGIQIERAVIHDIPGQHGFYIQAGNTRIRNARLRNLALSGVKIQAGDANAVLKNVTATGVVGYNIGSQLFEVVTAPPFTGFVRFIVLQGSGTRVGRGIGITRRVENLQANVTVTDVADAAVQLGGDALKNIDIRISATNIGGDGVFVFATRSMGLRIRPIIRNANRARQATSCGIRIESTSATVELINPDVSDQYGRMHYGLFNAIAGSRVRVSGKARFTGAADTAVRATGRIEGLPRLADLQGRNGTILNAANVTRR